MNFKLFILLVLLFSSTIQAKTDKDFSIAIELENNTLDVSDANLSKDYDNSSYYFWIKAIITNESMFPKKLATWSCPGFGFNIASDSVQTEVACLKNYSKNILLQPKETYKVRMPVSFKKCYMGDTLKLKINYPPAETGWSEIAIIKIRR